MVEAKSRLVRTFEFNGKSLEYFFHSYNNFRLTCRSIEIPIIKYYLNKYKPNRILEIGNVTKHYYQEFKDFKNKDTVDKYEIAYDVINVDIKDYEIKNKYNFIYSISTFEHMDSDGGKNPEYYPITNSRYSSHAFKNMDYVINNLLKEGGKFIVTFPIGLDNREIDNSLFKNEQKQFNVKDLNIYVFKQVDELKWIQLEDGVNHFKKGKNNKISFKNVEYIAIMDITK